MSFSVFNNSATTSSVLNIMKNAGVGARDTASFDAITTTSITNTGTMSSGATTLSGALNSGANYIITTGTGSFGALNATSIVDSGALTVGGTLNAGANYIITTGTGTFGTVNARTTVGVDRDNAGGNAYMTTLGGDNNTSQLIMGSGGAGSAWSGFIDSVNNFSGTGADTLFLNVSGGRVYMGADSTLSQYIGYPTQVLSQCVMGALTATTITGTGTFSSSSAILGASSDTSLNSLTVINDQGQSTQGVAQAVGQISTSALAGDTVLRSDADQLILQSGSGASALLIDTSNNVNIRNTSVYTTSVDRTHISQRMVGNALTILASGPVLIFTPSIASTCYLVSVSVVDNATNPGLYILSTNADTTGSTVTVLMANANLTASIVGVGLNLQSGSGDIPVLVTSIALTSA